LQPVPTYRRNDLPPPSGDDGDDRSPSVAQASPIDKKDLGTDLRSTCDEPASRALKTDLDLLEWHSSELKELRLAASGQVIVASPPEVIAASPAEVIAASPPEMIAENPPEMIAENPPEIIAEGPPEVIVEAPIIGHPPEPISEDQTDPVMILVSKARKIYDRLLPRGRLRRRIARKLFRAAVIVATEGVLSLFRKGANRLRRGLLPAAPAQQMEELQPAHQPEPLPSPVTPIDTDREATAYPVQELAQRMKSPHVMPLNKRGRFALLSSSLGNYYFNEIRNLIATGLADLGHVVVIRNEEDGFRDDVDWHIVVAPHEFFFLGVGGELRHSTWPENVIIVSTEQPSTKWFALSWECLRKAHAVWDIDFNTSKLLRDRGIDCDYLPLGYSPNHSAFGRVEELPKHYGTCFLGAEVLRSSYAGGALHERPMDILFVGSNTPRREAFFSRAAPVLSDYRSYLHLFDNQKPQRLGQTTYMDTATVNGLSQRSKVLLNIHHGKDVYFEWQRIVLQGLWHRTLVVSERCSLAPPFRGGIDYVEASIPMIPRVLRYYLSDPCGQYEAQEIADSGHRTLVAECSLGRFLRILLENPASAGAALAQFDRAESIAGSSLVRSA
jgi:hypothetical protein